MTCERTLIVIGRLAVALVAFGWLPVVEAWAEEPPIRCEITRGSWCILASPYQIMFSPVPGTSLNQWTLSESYWHKEAAIILESTMCPDRKAEVLEIAETNPRFLWLGRYWRRVVVRLTTDGECSLQLLAPTRSRAPLDMAVSAISTHVAACIDAKPCPEAIVGPTVYGVFRSMK